MTQETQTTLDRNTNIGKRSRLRNRNWCFTLNNYTREDIDNFISKEYEYLFQEETGENGTPHLQGLLMFKNAVAFSKVKSINSKAHWEVCKNKNASINYCKKNDSRTGEIFTNLDRSKFATHDTTQVNVGESWIEEKKFDPTNRECLDKIKKNMLDILMNDESINLENLILGYRKNDDVKMMMYNNIL